MKAIFKMDNSYIIFDSKNGNSIVGNEAHRVYCAVMQGYRETGLGINDYQIKNELLVDFLKQYDDVLLQKI